jgi:hypothetical protein
MWRVGRGVVYIKIEDKRLKIDGAIHWNCD